MDPTYKNAKILIVDDKESNIEILEALLEELDYSNYTSTTDSRQVVGLYQFFQPDLILLDLMMPHLDGFEVMEQLNSLIPKGAFLPILVLTADMTEKAKQRALSGGAKDFLSKPFNLNEVSQRIRNLLETRYLYQLLENQNQLLEEKVRARTLDLEKANQVLDQANRELKVLDQAKLEFLNLISHEIRTPLNGILGFTDILKSRTESDELLEYIEYLQYSAVRLERFAYQALLFTELRTQNYKLRIEEVPLSKLMENTKTQLRDLIQTKKTNLQVQIAPGIESILGDEKLLLICLNAILENSVKHSPANAVVLVKVYPEDKVTVLEFTDQGPGFSVATLDHLYDLFGLAEQHVDLNTGLSMVLVKMIMDLHQGEIKAINNPDKGATVSVRFKCSN